jgi:hypothetical protein
MSKGEYERRTVVGRLINSPGTLTSDVFGAATEVGAGVSWPETVGIDNRLSSTGIGKIYFSDAFRNPLTLRAHPGIIPTTRLG